MKIVLFEKSENVIDLVGNYFRITESSAPVQVTFEGGLKTQKVNLERGMAFAPDGGFIRLRLYSDTNQTIEIEATSGAIDDNRISGRVSVVIEALAGINTDRISLNDTVTLIAQPNAGRNRLQIKNVGTEPVYIGNIDCDANGYKIDANEEFEIKRAGGAELYAVSTVTGSTIHLFSEMDTAQAVSIPANVLTTESGANLLTESGEYLTA